MGEIAEMKIKALAGWYGGNRVLAERAGAELGKLAWCGVPFCGGCPELPHIDCRSGIANDLHRHIINLARVVAEPSMFAALGARLEGMLFHPDELAAAQARCRDREAAGSVGLFGGGAAASNGPDLAWAIDYVVCCWMGPGSNAGKAVEFTRHLSSRFTSSGGGSARRFTSAVESLPAWHHALRGTWEFTTVDAFAFIERVRDEKGHGLYIDAPWPDAGNEYRHPLDDARQERLARKLADFNTARVVVRFGDHPLIRELYPESRWRWVRQSSRDQSNGDVSEVLIVNGPSMGESTNKESTI